MLNYLKNTVRFYNTTQLILSINSYILSIVQSSHAIIYCVDCRDYYNIINFYRNFTTYFELCSIHIITILLQTYFKIETFYL